MTVAAVAMVRDEADVIEATVRHLFAEGVDFAVIADNLSSDGTRAILDDLAGIYDVTVIDDPVPAYEQATKTQHLINIAARRGADWVLPFDADEIFYSPDGCTLAEFFASCAADVVLAEGWDHVAQAGQVGPFSEWRRSHPQVFPKVALRPGGGRCIDMGNHGVTGEGARVGGLALRHFQYRSLEQMTRKVRQGAAAYAASTIDTRVYGAHWCKLARLSDDELAARWDAMCAEEGLVFDPAPFR